MRSAVVTAAAVLAAGTVVAVGSAATGDAAPVRPATPAGQVGFSNPAHNPYFPLTPGLVVIYRGTDGPGKYRERVTVTHHTKMVDGVRTRVLRDVLRRADGSLAEKTHDWYAADDAGNVWYFGENTGTYDRNGNLKGKGGSWEAGVDGAHRGLIMPADPRPTDAYRQEYRAGHAEDQAWIVQRTATATVPAGTYHHVVRSFEWSRLEKGVISTKLYARGVGILTEHDVSGGTEQFKAVKVLHR